ncbi:UNVERIFIED_CONTAM: hypothetical protein Sangu_1869200 [Sesamum angustifolium]|uniref:Uncharacterized protein n=1 Tax=Sesamum angustifolium TaxID=2727405 RepID=A0AAW2LTP5_9LAMI
MDPSAAGRLYSCLMELQARLASSIGGGDNLPVFLNILFKQVTLEKKIEAALVDDDGKGSLRKGMPSAASFSIREELLLRSGR